MALLGKGKGKAVDQGTSTEKVRLEGNAVEVEKARKARRKPWGLKWRTSPWYITTVVAVGVATDILTYTIVVPVLPYRLQALNYTNISALTSWLLFAYSIGIFICTFPVAYFFHKYPWRREPLVVAVIVLEGALVMFMLAKPFWLMVFSRFLQGCASTVVWTVGFALICENVEEKNIGRQIGFALAGVSIGSTIAPPIGGALYSRLGWYAPFIFCIVICAVDLVARLFVIERKQLVESNIQEEARDPSQTARAIEVEVEQKDTLAVPSTATTSTDTTASVDKEKTPEKQLSPWGVLVALAKSKRGMNGFIITFVFGLVIGGLDPTLTLRVQSVWHRNSDFVGLVYLAASAPTFVVGPLVGALADRVGAEWIIAPSLLATLPWLPLLLLSKSLPGFIVFFALSNVFLSTAYGPVGLELAMAARAVEGMSEIHQFAAMNLAFSISTAIGAIAGGQMYDHSGGWTAVCWYCFACCAIAVPFPFCFAGSRPLLDRVQGKQVDTSTKEDDPSGAQGGQTSPA